MASGPYSFIDIAVLDAVRQRFAEGDALAILTIDLETTLWANGGGAALLGYDEIEAAMGSSSGLTATARRQIAAARGFPRAVDRRQVGVRLASGMSSRLVNFVVSSITLPDGAPAVLLAEQAPVATSPSASRVAERVIAGIGNAGYFAAILDAEGAVAARSEGFERLGIEGHTLKGLVAEVAAEEDRLVKRLVLCSTGSVPAGIARLADEPAVHLLIAVDESSDDATASSNQSAPDVEETGELSVAHDAPMAAPLDKEEPIVAAPKPPTDAEEDVPSDADLPDRLEEDAAFTARQHSRTNTDDSSPVMTPAIASATDADSPAGDADDWYFNGQPGSRPAETNLLRPAAPDRPLGPVRFVWRTDAGGAFSAISPEFAAAVGPGAADIVGHPFPAVAERFGLDPDGEISRLLDHRDTWSGRTVLWPVEGTDLVVPVDLAALPNYGRDRTFEGFRGFGVARIGDAIVDPAARGLALDETTPPRNDDHAAADQTDNSIAENGVASEADSVESGVDDVMPDAFGSEVPVISIADRREQLQNDKVIRLAEHRPAPAGGQLSAGERSAFEEIRDRLRRDYEQADDDDRSPQQADDDTQAEAPVTGFAEPDDDIADLAALDGVERELTQASAADDPDTHPAERASSGFEQAEAEPDVETVSDVPPAGEPQDFDRDPPAPAMLAINAEAEPEDIADSESATDPILSPSPAAPAIITEGFLPSAFADDTRRTGVDATLIGGLPLPVLVHAGDDLYFANREFFALTGYSSLDQLRREGGLGRLFADGERRMTIGEDDRKLRLRTLGGDEFPVDAHLQSVRWQGGTALLLALRKVATEPAPAPPAAVIKNTGDSYLERRIAEMRTIVDTATDGVVLIAADGSIRSISRPAEALFGFDSAMVEGKPFHTLFAIESQRAARDYLNGLAENGVASVLNDGREVIGREAEGRFIPLFMTIGRLPQDGGFCAVVRDITQWKRAEEDLTQARSLAERASSQKTEFLARVSHEIRTPLNAIIGFSELMIDEKFGPIDNDRYRDYLRDINRSGNHVLDLVNDLLDISKIEAGEQEMNYEAVSLNDTLAECVAMMQPQANRDRVIIRSSLASRLPEVVADLRSVRQIALNLLSNAIRYTQAGGQVIVSTSYEPSGDVVMRVRDTGIGMSLTEIDQAMKPFKQINALKRGRHDGTGLGLPLTKAMVEANRARFAISSTPGEGTMVEITFPSTRVLAD